MSDAVSEANSWLIKRNCSAGPGQLAVVFGLLVAVSFAFRIGFAAFGLWMALPFVGIAICLSRGVCSWGARSAVR